MNESSAQELLKNVVAKDRTWKQYVCKEAFLERNFQQRYHFLEGSVYKFLTEEEKDSVSAVSKKKLNKALATQRRKEFHDKQITSSVYPKTSSQEVGRRSKPEHILERCGRYSNKRVDIIKQLGWPFEGLYK